MISRFFSIFGGGVELSVSNNIYLFLAATGYFGLVNIYKNLTDVIYSPSSPTKFNTQGLVIITGLKFAL